MNFYLTATYGSGNVYTTPTQLTPENELLYEKKNNYILPYYQRLDIGIDTKFQLKNIKQEFKFEVYNLLNRKNPFYIIYKGSSGRLENSDFQQVYVFPIFPSFSYKIIF